MERALRVEQELRDRKAQPADFFLRVRCFFGQVGEIEVEKPRDKERLERPKASVITTAAPRS